MTQMVRAMVLEPMEEPMVEARRALEVLAPYERAPLELAPSEESEWMEIAPSGEPENPRKHEEGPWWKLG